MNASELQSNHATIRIGALAARAGVSVESLRYYEQRGLLRPARRRESGYREYPEGSVQLVRFNQACPGAWSHPR